MSTVASDPAQVLFGSTRRAVLALLLGRPDERFHLREVARQSGAGLGPVQRELATLVAAGIVRRESSSGRQVYFQAERASPIFAELQSLIQKTAGAVPALRDALRPVEARVRAAVVFGSMARGDVHADSDVDLLVISDDLTFRDLAGAIRRASARLGREVNLNLYKSAEWLDRVGAGHSLALSILEQPRLTVIGGEHEVERLAKERVAQTSPDKQRRGEAPVRGDRPRPARQRRRQR